MEALALRAATRSARTSRRLPSTSRVVWACPSCRSLRFSNRRWNSNAAPGSSSRNKPYYLTTPIFYVNAAPHIGHLYTMVLADVLKRWQQINGKEAKLCTGTDEHGMKIQQAAAKANLDPEQFCALNSDKFRELAASADISNDFFIRTTDEDHKKAVAEFWTHLKYSVPKELGLYEGAHEGWYSVSDECFYPEDMVRPSLHNQSGEKIFINTETENEVEWISEKTWFFPLSKYKERLLKFYDENPEWIQPKHKMNEVRDWVENHLEDLSITRPAKRLSWGIRDPEDNSQTIYVWVDALINYITKAGYGSKWSITSKEDEQGLWPADLHIIGKDILRFHTIYWPALLMAVGLPLPKQVLCHTHWTMSNRKMSKSIGNVVSPHLALGRWGIDPLRYFLMRNGMLSRDMDYSNELIGVAYQKDLSANIGNLLLRVNRPKKKQWSVAEAVREAREDRTENDPETGKKQVSKMRWSSTLTPYLKKSAAEFSENMEQFNIAAAIRVTFELLRETNRFFTDSKPWTLVADDGPDSRLFLNPIIYQAAEALRIAGILLQPIMPTKASLMLDQLGVKPENRTVQMASLGMDFDYGVQSSEDSDQGTSPTQKKRLSQVNKWDDALFPPLAGVDLMENETLKEVTSAFGRSKNKMNRMAKLLALEARIGEEAAEEWAKNKTAMVKDERAAKKEEMRKQVAQMWEDHQTSN